MTNLKKIKKIAIEAAKSSGKILLQRYENFDRGTVKLKSHHEIVTSADKASEKNIIGIIRKNFSDHQILAEESGESKNKSDYLWIIDPLDGTTNFSIHSPLWSISIGVAYKGELILGVVYAPYLNELFLAEKGKGASLNNKKIYVSKIRKGKVINTYCHGTRDQDIKKAIKIYAKLKLSGLDCRQLGSAALELAFVACGRVESITIPGANAWDIAAGVLLVQEAGGIVSDLEGDHWDFESDGVMATNSLVHKELLEIIKNIVRAK